ncbi:uncharacterized protein LOC142231236 [Haematobia irritans]|uniref:uncharacterized protein LOC142231236 n=1 Tax=Haematobia irritans TaxID=7368 RepID=UPI003F4F9542
MSLSPLLFALYINDLHEYLEDGIFVGGKNIRILMYADDIVIMADEIQKLQNMILKLEEYCTMWNMEVNTDQSKIMIFRNGGRLSNQEKWYFNGQEIEIVKSYVYLGVVLTSRLSFQSHVDNRTSQSKSAINSTWKNFLKIDSIDLQMKWEIYLAVCRSIQAYSAQVWGYTHFEEVDKLQRFFIKRVLKLPENTPNYVIDLETNIEDAHMYTLQLHLQYIYRTLFEYKADRLPNFFSKILLQKNLSWAKTINELLSHLGEGNLELNTTNLMWRHICSRLVHTHSWVNRLNKIENAMGSSTRIYRFLDFSKGSSYLNGSYNQKEITLIMRARADMLYLNGNKFTSNEEIKLCTICNLRETESIQHFLGRCPIFVEIRRQIFGTDLLSQNEILNILNGQEANGWKDLLIYLKLAMKYRAAIINEFY